MTLSNIKLTIPSIANDIVRYRQRIDYRLNRLDEQNKEILNLLKDQNSLPKSNWKSVQEIILFPFYILNIVLLEPAFRGYKRILSLIVRDN